MSQHFHAEHPPEHASNAPNTVSNGDSTTASPVKFYASVSLAGAAVYGILCGLAVVAPVGVVGALGVASTSWLCVQGIRQTQAVGEALKWQIQGEEDLGLARRAAEANMKGAAVLMARLYPMLLFSLTHSVYWAGLALVALMLLLSPWALGVEARFRAIKCADESLSARFNRIIKAWAEPRWTLPPNV
jgi:hypothetical protein